LLSHLLGELLNEALVLQITMNQICPVYSETQPDSTKIKWSAPNNKIERADSTNSIVSSNPIMLTSFQDLKLVTRSMASISSIFLKLKPLKLFTAILDQVFL